MGKKDGMFPYLGWLWLGTLIFFEGGFWPYYLGELWAQNKQIGCKIILEKLDFKLEGKMITFEPCKNSCNIDTVGVWPWPYFTDEKVKTQRGLWSDHGGNFPSSPVAETSPFNLGGVGTDPCLGSWHLASLTAKKLDIEQRQCCNKFS